MDTALKFVADELERLLALPLRSKGDLDAWYLQARKLQKAVKEHAVELPEEVWHFLADADTRSKPHEAEYRALQEEMVRKCIEALRSAAYAS
jgi:hypothetical protein